MKTLLILLFLSGFFPSASAQNKASAITKDGLGALSTETRRIVTYVPRNTLLYNLGDEIPQKGRKYIRATTHDGHTYYFLELGIERRVDNYSIYDFLINREVPACEKADYCHAVWPEWDAGRRGIIGKWTTIYPGTGGKYIDPVHQNSDAAVIPVKLQISGVWKDFFIPNRKGNNSIEDLGYTLVLNRRYPLYEFTEYETSEFNTVCNEQVKTVSINNIESEIHLSASAGASVEITPKLGAAFLKPLLKFVGLDAKVEASVAGDGSIKVENKKEDETSVLHGAVGQSWQNKIVTLKKFDDNTDRYHEIGKILIKKTYNCSGTDITETLNVRVEVYLSDVGEDIDFNNPYFDANINPRFISDRGLRSNSQYKEVLSLGYDDTNGQLGQNLHQTDYNKFMNFMTGQKDIPPTISHLILKEINRSPSLDNN